MNYEYKIQRILEANTAKYYMNKLGYSFKDLEPHIGRKTMKFHYDVHYRNFTKGLNEALGNRPKPNITAVVPSSIFAVFVTAPSPVVTPHPI